MRVSAEQGRTVQTASGFPRPRDGNIAFLDEIDRRARSGESWNVVAAGLLALRTVDGRHRGDSPAAWGLGAIEEMVDGLEPDPIREALQMLVLALGDQEPLDAKIESALMAYARSLEDGALWKLAVDVYRTVLRKSAVRETRLAADCCFRLGQCYRNLGALPRAARAFRRSATLARRAGDANGVLVAQVSGSMLVTLRGNYPLARRQLNRIIRRSRLLGLDDVQSRALHERANVAAIQGEYESGLRLGYRALGICKDRRERDRILCDIGFVFLNLNWFEAARYIFAILGSSAVEQFVRWCAHANLLEIASLTHDAAEFIRHEATLARVNLPPYVAASVQIILGEGYGRFGDSVKAVAHLKSALAIAAEHGLNRLVMEAEQALTHQESQHSGSATAPATASEEPVDATDERVRRTSLLGQTSRV